MGGATSRNPSGDIRLDPNFLHILFFFFKASQSRPSYCESHEFSQSSALDGNSSKYFLEVALSS